MEKPSIHHEECRVGRSEKTYGKYDVVVSEHEQKTKEQVEGGQQDRTCSFSKIRRLKSSEEFQYRDRVHRHDQRLHPGESPPQNQEVNQHYRQARYFLSKAPKWVVRGKREQRKKRCDEDRLRGQDQPVSRTELRPVVCDRQIEPLQQRYKCYAQESADPIVRVF